MEDANRQINYFIPKEFKTGEMVYVMEIRVHSGSFTVWGWGGLRRGMREASGFLEMSYIWVVAS